MLVELLVSRLMPRRRQLAAATLAMALGIGLALYPAAYQSRFAVDARPRVSALVRELPKDTLIVGASSEVDSLSSFTGRQVLFSYEHSLAFHPGYYAQIATRIEDGLRA
jgi:hypothetical protein